MTRIFLFSLGLVCLHLSSPALTGSDWTRFRGPNGDGVVTEKVPVEWTAKTNRLWTTELVGKGNSSPIIVGNNVFVQTATKDGSRRMLVCLDAQTGAIKWNKSASGHATKIHAKSSYASCTPASDGKNVYACFWDGDVVSLHAFSQAGEELWSASMGSFASQHGAGMSPIVHKGKVFINFDQDKAAEVVAYDASTGAKVWSAPRKGYYACYSTPILRELPGGSTEMIVYSTAGAAGYDLDTGKLNWEWTTPWKNGEMALRSVASPILVGNILVGVNGDGSGSRYSVGLDLAAPGEPKILWEKRAKTAVPYVPCPLARDGHIYWITDQGIAECVNAKTGEVIWTERVFNRGVSSSPIMIGDTVLAIDESGKAMAWKATPEGYEPVATSDVGEPVFASPAVANGRLYIRGVSKLLCIGTKE